MITCRHNSIKLIKSVKDPRVLGIVLVYAAIAALVYYSLFSRRLSPSQRGELSAATFWLVFPFIPGCGVIALSVHV